MNPDQIFQLVNSIALLSWIILILFPFKDWSKKLLLGVVITGFALLYCSLVLIYFSADPFDYLTVVLYRKMSYKMRYFWCWRTSKIYQTQ
jgi:hypothetical protein